VIAGGKTLAADGDGAAAKLSALGVTSERTRLAGGLLSTGPRVCMSIHPGGESCCDIGRILVLDDTPAYLEQAHNTTHRASASVCAFTLKVSLNVTLQYRSSACSQRPSCMVVSRLGGNPALEAEGARIANLERISKAAEALAARTQGSSFRRAFVLESQVCTDGQCSPLHQTHSERLVLELDGIL